MNLRNLSAWSIRNPIVPIVLFIGLLLAGVVAFNRMDVNGSPDIDFPGVNVLISQPGAAPTEIETQITQKVEAAVRSINGVDEIQSTASEGSSSTFVQFVIGTDANDAVNEVKNAVDQIRSDLPDGILEPRVAKIEVGGNGPIGYYAVSADDMTMEQLSWFVDDTVSRKLMSIAGMAAVSRAGGVDREIRVVLDPARMQSLGVTASQINQVLRQVNVDAAGGRAEIAGSRQSVRVLGNAEDAYRLGETRINSSGRIIRLRDVADVYDGYSEQTSIAKIRGQQVVTFSLERAKGASDVTVYDEAQKVIEQLQKENRGIHITELYTSVEYTKDQYSTSMEAMIEGAVLAIVVVFLFLRDWRATIISAIAIPLSAIPTFWFMDLLGFTLNELSLLALSLVAGVLVDDAIVEIENIVRHMRMGKSAYQAAIDAADEIGLAVMATTFSIVAVFLPVGLMPGISGQFFKNFGLTVVAAVLMSLAVARMITPMIAAYFLKAKGHQEHGGGWLMDLYMKVLAWSLDTRVAQAMRVRLTPVRSSMATGLVETLFVLAVLAALVGGGYGAVKLAALIALPKAANVPIILIGSLAGAWLAIVILNAVIGALGGVIAEYHEFFRGRVRARLRDHRLWCFGIGVGALGLTLAMFYLLPMQFQPLTDSDSSRANIEMVPGTTIEQTEEVADRVSEILSQQQEVRLVMERVNEGSATLFIMLKPDRQNTSIEFERRLNKEFQNIPDARVTFSSQSGGGGTGRDISVMLAGSDPKLLQDAAQALVDQMKGVKGVVAPRIAADLQRPELVIVPRLDLAAQLGVTTSALSQTIRIATMGEIDQNAAKFSLSDRQVPIRVILPKDSRRDISTIENLPVTTASGGSVPLKRVAEITFGAGPTQIQRYNQSRRIFVGADLAEGALKGPVMDQVNKLPIMKNLPAGVSNNAVGDDKWQAELIQNFITAVVSGILLVFGVLVLLYRRFVSPLVNMTSLLLAPLGGLMALALLGQPISISVYIGLLMLLGIVAKNSILLIDFAIEEMERGESKQEAILEAGHKRAQPIVMTTMAMTAGMVPTALSLSGDAAWRAPMGTTVIGGLILSTLLTLLIVPAGFSLADGFEKRLGPWLRRNLLTYRPGDDHRDKSRAEALPAE
ncbi:efflux RND transporter permease subunit [Altererythrobacter sp. CC-YST694]|uniref:efflux RND transporter permease subunit n=1 Tax=Altererythrobacter sp. CC-YST694 TaxID=2755038 RepID=UPI001D017777|nr:efflux RND transporter permease subunit [Altererythrobacter sp. CC-YST694]MCB5425314.1 efflux RND transporter permease subunit [Altererythrobacter sp. CC-YST694]